MFRHKDLKELRDLAEEDPLEVEASKFALNYIKLDGNDRLHGQRRRSRHGDHGHHPVRRRRRSELPRRRRRSQPGADRKRLRYPALSDPNVKAIFINIFGGILRVDVLAQGVVNAAKKLNVQIPIILRLEGTNVEEGRQILADSGLNFQVGTTMKEAADLAVAAANK